MKVSINKRSPNAEGLQQLRLVYYYGMVEGEDEKKHEKYDYEPLQLQKLLVVSQIIRFGLLSVST